MAIEPGEFCWHELVTADPAAATAFYTHVVGWTAKVSEDPDKPCTVMLAPGGRAVASIARRRSEGIDGATVPSWVGHVLVESLDDAVTRLAAAGGLVRDRPIATLGKGRFASVLDPDGAEFRLFEAAAGTADMPTLFGSPGYVGWRELHATDRDMAFACKSARVLTPDRLATMTPRAARQHTGHTERSVQSPGSAFEAELESIAHAYSHVERRSDGYELVYETWSAALI